jgi:hypothetical protein
MPKYYRVRTQEQWNWLMQKLEKENDKLRTVSWFAPERKPTELTPEIEIDMSDVVVFVKEPECLEYGTYEDFMNSDRSKAEFNFIEVSQMMKESRMKDYVEVGFEDLLKIKDSNNVQFFDLHSKDDVYSSSDSQTQALYIPKSLLYPKVSMTEAEKKEFDMAAGSSITPIESLEEIESSCGDEYPCLFNKMFCGQTEKDNNKAQIEFIRALADPSIIEVIPEKKWNVKVPVADGPTFYFKTGDGVDVCKPSPTMQNLETTRFTAEEIKYYHLDNDLFEKVEVQE